MLLTIPSSFENSGSSNFYGIIAKKKYYYSDVNQKDSVNYSNEKNVNMKRQHNPTSVSF